MVALPKEGVEAYVKDMAAVGETAWVVGEVVEGKKTASIRSDCEFFDAY